MSIKLMSLVWELSLPPGEKLVLLALADQANDEGVQCWPSVATIAHRSGQGERTVRRALADLEKQGHLTRQYRDGTSTQYHVHPCHSGTPARTAPLPKTTKTPAKLAGKPSRTTTPSEATASSGSRAKRKWIRPDDIPGDAWDGFEEMRRRIGKPMTDHARDLAVKRLRALAEDGWPPGDVLNHCTLNAYQGIFPPKDRPNGYRQPAAGQGAPKRGSPALELYRRGALREAEEARAGQDGAADWGAGSALPAFGAG